jgi:hypothetical protein
MKWLKFFIISGLFLPFACQAVGVSVEPSELDILYPSQTKYSFTVTNISPEPIIVAAYADAFQENIILQPSEVKLLPNEVTEVVVKANFADQPAGVKSTYISVVSKAVDKRSFNAASGIKLPFSVNITETTWAWSGEVIFVMVFVGLMVLAILVQLVFLIWQAKKKKRHWRGVNLLLHRKKYRLFKK